jgi:hypothetical protein
MSFISKSRYTMLADVYRQTTTRDSDTRQVIREWSFSHTIRCQARGVVNTGIRVVGATEDYQMSGNYEDIDWVKFQSSSQLSKRDRVSSIRHKTSGSVSWKNDDGTPIEFEVMGSQPLPTPFGKISQYDSLLYRVQDE